MKNLKPLFISILLTLAVGSLCAQTNKTKVTDSEILVLKTKKNKSAIVVIKMDAAEIAALEDKEGADFVRSASEGVLQLHSKLEKKLKKKSIGFSDKKTTTIEINNQEFTITKDDSFTYYTYFICESEKLVKTDIYSLLDLYKVK